MQLNPSEISELIKDRIKNFEGAAEARTEGTVVSLMDGIARIHGLAEVMSGEMVEFPGNTYGMALNLERDSVGAVILGDYKHISEGDTVKCTGRILEVPVGEAMLGRVVNSLGEPIDGKGPIESDISMPIERIAPGVIERQSVSQPMQTGLKAIDAMRRRARGGMWRCCSLASPTTRGNRDPAARQSQRTWSGAWLRTRGASAMGGGGCGAAEPRRRGGCKAIRRSTSRR